MLTLAAVLFTSNLAFASPPSHDASPTEINRAVGENLRYHERLTHFSGTRPFHPVEDTADFAYVLMSAYDGDSSEVAALREKIARNLPPPVQLVLLADEQDAGDVRAKYEQWIPSDRLIVATGTNTQGGFWARDSFPVPVYDGSRGGMGNSLVAAHYYREFDAWDAVAQGVAARMVKKEFTFVGGNLLSDGEGNCFSVDSYRLFTVTEDDLAQAYGCRKVHLMKHVRGLGDVDEVLKPLPGKRMLTNSPEYKQDLEEWGYKVILLPTSPEPYRTYVNSLVVGQIVFMPSYGASLDGDAQKVYENLGYHVVPVTTVELSDEMHGSVHCQTMAYPGMTREKLLRTIGARDLL